MINQYDIIRLPGAPSRRAGRVWPEGIVVRVSDLSASQIDALESDPGYHVTRIAGLTGEPLVPVPARAPMVTGGLSSKGSPVRLSESRAVRGRK